jgi:hypothetical protein
VTRSTADLREYLDAIDLCYFDGHMDDLGVDIRWMRARDPASVPRLGCYWNESRLIEIARPLADESVPRQFVCRVIHHECLHAVHGSWHSKPFEQAERLFLFHFEAAEWERLQAHIPWPAAPKGLR